jgi:hypothetical protein
MSNAQIDTDNDATNRSGKDEIQNKLETYNTFAYSNGKLTNKQIGNYFPNSTDDHIDYVIYYKTHDQLHFYKDKFQEREVEIVREHFFNVLVDEYKFKRHTIAYKQQDHTEHYVFLSCSTSALMDEAERIKLEIRLKAVSAISLLV